MGRGYLAEHTPSASENWQLGWEEGASARRGRPGKEHKAQQTHVTSENAGEPGARRTTRRPTRGPRCPRTTDRGRERSAPPSAKSPSEACGTVGRTNGTGTAWPQQPRQLCDEPSGLPLQAGKPQGSGEPPEGRVRRGTGCGEAPGGWPRRGTGGTCCELKKQRFRDILAKRSSS